MIKNILLALFTISAVKSFAQAPYKGDLNGTITKHSLDMDECKVSEMNIKYHIFTDLGQPEFVLNVAWQTSGADPACLPGKTVYYIIQCHTRNAGAYVGTLYINAGSGGIIRQAGQGYGDDMPGSPDYNSLFIDRSSITGDPATDLNNLLYNKVQYLDQNTAIACWQAGLTVDDIYVVIPKTGAGAKSNTTATVATDNSTTSNNSQSNTINNTSQNNNSNSGSNLIGTQTNSSASYSQNNANSQRQQEIQNQVNGNNSYYQQRIQANNAAGKSIDNSFDAISNSIAQNSANESENIAKQIAAQMEKDADHEHDQERKEKRIKAYEEQEKLRQQIEKHVAEDPSWKKKEKQKIANDASKGYLIISSTTWAISNLAVTTFRNGDAIPEVENEKEWYKACKNHKPAWCYYKGDEATAKYGKLYNLYAVIDNRTLEPLGWHSPYDDEMENLKNLLAVDKEVSEAWTTNYCDGAIYDISTLSRYILIDKSSGMDPALPCKKPLSTSAQLDLELGNVDIRGFFVRYVMDNR